VFDGDKQVHVEFIHRGCMICPGCFSIEPTDGRVFVPSGADSFSANEFTCWQMDGAKQRLVYTCVTPDIETVTCNRCFQQTKLVDVGTGIEPLGQKGIAIRLIGLRGSLCEP